MTPTTIHATTKATSQTATQVIANNQANTRASAPFCQQHPASPAQIEDQAIQLQREVADIVREEIGMHEGFANDIAAAIVRGLRKRYGGRTLGARGSIYIPAPDKSARNAAIRAEFNGTNADDVCRRHDISRSRLYQLVGKNP